MIRVELSTPKETEGCRLVSRQVANLTAGARACRLRDAIREQTETASVAGAILAGLALSQTFFCLRASTVRRNVPYVKFRV